LLFTQEISLLGRDIARCAITRKEPILRLPVVDLGSFNVPRPSVALCVEIINERPTILYDKRRHLPRFVVAKMFEDDLFLFRIYRFKYRIVTSSHPSRKRKEIAVLDRLRADRGKTLRIGAVFEDLSQMLDATLCGIRGLDRRYG